VPTLAPSNTPQPSNTQTRTKTPAPTNTALATRTLKPTEAANPTPTPTRLPAKLAEQIVQNYEALEFMQATTILLNEMAGDVQAGKLSSEEAHGSLLALAALSRQISGVITQTVVLAPLQADWERAIVVHQKTTDILSRWLNQKIEPGAVLSEAEPLLAEIEAALVNAERTLETLYGFDANLLARQRHAAMKEARKAIAPTATPKASPTRTPRPAVNTLPPQQATATPTQ